MRGGDFIYDSVQLIYCTCHRIKFKRGGSYIDSSDWIKKKKSTTNPKNSDNACFQYVVTVALNYHKTESHPKRVSNT